MGYGSQKKKGITKQKFITFSSIFFLILLFLSSLADRSPLRTISSIGELFSKNPDPVAHYSRDQLLAVVRKKETEIDSLNHVIEGFKVVQENDHARVEIDSEELNVRSAPSINSNVIFKIPDSTIVEILLFDSETFVVAGKSGSWCKIQYGGEKGWVWGNYLQKVITK